MNRNFIKMSLVSVVLLSTGAYAGKIIGVTSGTPHELTDPPTQYGFGGWNLDNVKVNITSNEDFNTIIAGAEDIPMTDTNGKYPEMNASMSFESIIYSDDQRTEIRGKLHGKDWPVGEPAGIKVVNDDAGTAKSGKSPNCIMTTSYLDEVDSGTGETGYLSIYDINPDGIAVPTVCSSPFQSHKRFKVNMQDTMVEEVANAWGKPFDLTFNLDPDDNSTETRRYQVFSKINNYTGMRLDGYTVELFDENGTKVDGDNQIKFSLVLTTKEESEDESGFESVFAHGLWGPVDKHFPEIGFFDSTRAGFVQEGNNTQELLGGTTLGTLGSNYVDLFGIWLPSKWAPYGIFFDDDNDPTTDAELVAFWGKKPDEPMTTAPRWLKGIKDGWVDVTSEELLAWIVDPLYSVGKIEDTLNLGLNYVVEIGKNSTIGKTFTIRITPHTALDQTRPNYIDAEDNYIMPPTDYNDTEVRLVISPSPEFTIGTNLSVGLADTELNTDVNVEEEYVITLTASNGDEENLTLTETDVNSSVFVGTIGTDLDAVSQQDGTVNVTNGTVVTVTYKTLTATTTATDGTPVINPSTGGGGGCTYNPNNKTFDLTFLMLMALGSLYAFRRRFIK